MDGNHQQCVALGDRKLQDERCLQPRAEVLLLALCASEKRRVTLSRSLWLPKSLQRTGLPLQSVLSKGIDVFDRCVKGAREMIGEDQYLFEFVSVPGK